jgi:hypothetical protein
MQPELSGSHRSTYDAMFQHPVARNLHWREVRSMLDAVGNVVEEHNGNLKVTRNGQVLLLQRPRKNITEVQAIMDIRRFLERSGEPPAAAAADGTHLLVVIDHREARIYKAELSGSVPQRVVPYDPHGFGRYLHYVQNDSNGQRRPEAVSFYEAVAKTLQGAAAILVFGSGTGASSAMDQLLAQLKRHHPELAGRVIASVAVDEGHLTENQLLAMAREFFAAPRSGSSTSK